ncbi:MAG: glycosyltransferase [Planctomycetota bacterium]|nr:glycosyltransferase [Planctomycetota bacterium]
MDALWLGSSVCLLALWVLLAVDVLRGWRQLPILRSLPVGDGGEQPHVTIIVPARNEERAVAAGVATLVAQDYGPLDVIAVNDRSTDRTGAILDELATGSDRLRVLHIEALPEGWLGKNHAMWRAAAEAKGELLLFTDADVEMDPSAVSRAVTHLVAGKLDHLAVIPAVRSPTRALRWLMGSFALMFLILTRPWNAPNPKRRGSLGVGAFNLVRREAYAEAGTHEAIRLHPVDDLKLGEVLKLGGAAQQIALGRGMIEVEWYDSVGAFVRGLEKNSFALQGYSVLRTCASLGLLLLVYAWPWVGCFLVPGVGRWLLLGCVALALIVFLDTAPPAGTPRRYALAFPIATLVVGFAVLRSMLITLRNGGITWRDTHYPLKALRSAQRP